MSKTIQILDCTLRDGGLGFEDARKNGLSKQEFSLGTIRDITHHLKNSNLDIIELGSIEITPDDRRGFAIYNSIESISKTIPQDRLSGQMYAALYRGPDTPIEDIPNWNPDLCEAVRVILRYSELQKSLDFCAALSQKGYQVFVQPMLTMRYTDDEIQHLIDSSNDMGAHALYFVDSYGFMQAQDVIRLFQRYDAGLDPSIKIGFHAHNNMNLAFANALTMLAQPSERNIILDSCVLGLGQGAGNLQTEIIADHLNRCHNGHYIYSAILEVCEIIETYQTPNTWGYSLTRLLPAIHKTAYKYAIALRHQYGLTFPELNQVLSQMPEDLRHRYTPENTRELLRRCGYSKVLGEM